MPPISHGLHPQLLAAHCGGMVECSCLTDLPLGDNIVFATNGTTVMTTSKRYDALNRLTNIVRSGTGCQPVNLSYQYNSTSQRTAITVIWNYCCLSW